MGQSHNPEGTTQVADRELVATLREILSDSDKLAVPARDVAEELPIKKQAVRKRLDRLAKSDGDVARFKGAQAWLYYVTSQGDIIEPDRGAAASHDTVSDMNRPDDNEPVEQHSMSVFGELFSRKNARAMDLPGVLPALVIAGIIGWAAYGLAGRMFQDIVGEEKIIENGKIDIRTVSALFIAAGTFLAVGAAFLWLAVYPVLSVALAFNAVWALAVAAFIPIAYRLVGSIAHVWVTMKTTQLAMSFGHKARSIR